jgi:Spy/CpxP family protein refolding chaperone
MTMMRKTLPAVAAFGLAVLTACSSGTFAPDESALLAEGDEVELVPDYAVSSAAAIDGAGIGGAGLPAELRLTAEQKAQIAELHDAFQAENAEEIAALRELERQIRALHRNGGSRAELRALHQDAHEILRGLADDFAELQEAIWAIYTPEQRAWIEAHRPRVCGPDGPPRLTEEQIAAIRALQKAFQEAMADEFAAIKAAHQAARAAHQAGASREDIEAILAEVEDEMQAVRQAEQRLMNAIQDILTPDQRASWCIVRRHVSPRG